MFRANERDWIAPNPPAGAWINVYRKQPSKDPISITIADRTGRTVRVLRNLRAAAGVNRFAWDLRWANPAERPQAAVPGMEGVPAAVRERFGMGSFGPPVLPGEYAVKVVAGGRELSGTVAVSIDPRVQAAPADLEAQLKASFEALALQARVSDVIDHADAMTAQLTALDAQLAKQTPPPAVRAQVTQTLGALKTFRDNELARPLPGLGYRQYPRLREDVQSLSGYLMRGFRAPNAGELERMKDLTAQVDQAVAKLNGFIAKEIAAINEAMKSSPRIAVEPIK
jgi:hypothetical protein